MGYEKDVASIDAIINAIYDVISGPAGAKDWERERFLIHPAARMMPGSPAAEPPTPGLKVMTTEQFIEYAGPRLLSEDFYEYETGREEFRFGRWVHVVSAYASAHGLDQPPFARGINDIQLWFEGGRWWVMTVLWDWQDEANPIPDRFLRKPG